MGEAADVQKDDIISNMTYSDYLSAVYSYEEKARKKALFDKKLPPMKKANDEKKEAFNRLKTSAEENRKKREKIHDAAITNQREQWKKTQERLDVKIAQETGRAKQQAEAEISKRRDEFSKKSAEFNEKVRFLKSEKSRLNSEYEDLLKTQESLENYSGDFFPVADKSALELLETAKRKRWLSAYHKELLRKNVNEVCSKRIHSFEELHDREVEFAGSQMAEDIRKGEVTDVVIREFTKFAAISFAVLMGLFCLIAFVDPLLTFFIIFQSAASCLAAGYGLMKLAEFIGRKYIFDKDKVTPVERSVVIAAFVLGGIAGFFLWKGLIFDHKNIFSFIYSLISTAASTLLFREVLLTDIAAKLLKKLPFLKNRARYYVFKDSVKKENGKYNLQIYCYLNHSEVLQYLSIEYKDQISIDIENKKELNRNIYEKDKQELSGLSARKRELDVEFQKLEAFEKHRKLRLRDEINMIESKRGDPEPPDFESMLPQKVTDELKKLDEEYDDLKRRIESTEEDTLETERRYSIVEKKYNQLSHEYELIESALRYWYKTPTPSATDYRLLDSICFESNKQLSIIHHRLKPYAFRYTVSHKDADPGRSLKSTIFRYIRGLIKINPCRLLQINIIDPVSDPSILLEDPLFKRLTDSGIINGVSTMNDFEIRLFSSSKNYSTFRTVFKTQCAELQKVISENTKKTGKKAPFSVESANRIKGNDKEPFMYQVMMFVVPRAFDQTDFEPPTEIVKTMENGTYLKFGLLPVFFVDNDSIHEKWKHVVEMCPEGCLVNRGKGQT